MKLIIILLFQALIVACHQSPDRDFDCFNEGKIEVCYELGVQAKSPEEGKKYFERACQGGHTPSCEKLQ